MIPWSPTTSTVRRPTDFRLRHHIRERVEEMWFTRSFVPSLAMCSLTFLILAGCAPPWERGIYSPMFALEGLSGEPCGEWRGRGLACPNCVDERRGLCQLPDAPVLSGGPRSAPAQRIPDDFVPPTDAEDGEANLAPCGESHACGSFQYCEEAALQCWTVDVVETP